MFPQKRNKSAEGYISNFYFFSFFFMNNTKKTLLAGAVMLVVAIPALTFASGGLRGGHMGFGGNSGSGFTLPASVQTALTASGIAIPTADEMKTERDAMQKVGDAMKTLSDADKATLKTMRDTAQRAERDFLRTKGVPFPSEESIAKFQTFQQALHTLKGGKTGENNGLGEKMGRGHGRGMMDNDGDKGGFGGRGMMGR